MRPPRKAVLISLKGMAGKVSRNTGAPEVCPVFTVWDKDKGVGGGIILPAGEHLLLLGYKAHRRETRQWEGTSYKLVANIQYFLEFLRVKTGRYVWIQVQDIYNLIPLHEKGRRELVAYIKKNRLNEVIETWNAGFLP